VTQWLGRNRFGALLPNFRNYNGRDLLRLTRDDIIAMCGVSDGIRLYNDLHLVEKNAASIFLCFPKNLIPYRDSNQGLLVPEADAVSTAPCRQGAASICLFIFRHLRAIF
jgi:hypothetical protein